MNPYAVHAAALQRQEAFLAGDCPQFTWNGQTWNMLPGSARTNQPLSSGGFSMDYDLKFDVTLSTFLAVAASAQLLKNLMLNTIMVYLGDTYKIETVNIHPGGLSLSIQANAYAQGA